MWREAAYSRADWRARSFVLGRGKNGCEHAYYYSASDQRFLGHHTDGLPDMVTIPARVATLCKRQQERVSFHHNHPSRTPLSYGDIELLGRFAGLVEISAHCANGGIFRARRATRWRSSWSRRLRVLDVGFTLQSLTLQSIDGFPGALEMHAFSLLLDRTQLIEYTYRLDDELRADYDTHRDVVDFLVRDIAACYQGRRT